MAKDDMEQYIAERIIPDLKQEGFESSLEHDENDDYVTLTVQRKHRYY